MLVGYLLFVFMFCCLVANCCPVGWCGCCYLPLCCTLVGLFLLFIDLVVCWFIWFVLVLCLFACLLLLLGACLMVLCWR